MRLIDADALKVVVADCELPTIKAIPIASMQRIIDSAPTIPQWTKINGPEGLPPRGSEVLLRFKPGYYDVYIVTSKTFEGDKIEKFSHWMPIPKLPKDE